MLFLDFWHKFGCFFTKHQHFQQNTIIHCRSKKFTAHKKIKKILKNIKIFIYKVYTTKKQFHQKQNRTNHAEFRQNYGDRPNISKNTKFALRPDFCEKFAILNKHKNTHNQRTKYQSILGAINITNHIIGRSTRPKSIKNYGRLRKNTNQTNHTIGVNKTNKANPRKTLY